MTRLPGAGRQLIAVVGPSGAGKDSLISAWLATLEPPWRPHRARRTITRDAAVEASGAAAEHHEPMARTAFLQALQADAFALHWAAHGLLYGVRHAELAPLAHGRWVVFSGSRAHLPQLQAQAPGLRVVMVTAAPATRAARLHARGRESSLSHAPRLARDPGPVSADLVIHNDGPLAAAVSTLAARWRETTAQEPQR